MEETLEKFKDLLKYTLAENHRIDKSSLLENFSIINDYSAEEVYEELKNLIENLLVSKESLKSTQKFSKIPSHIHFTDLPTERNLLLRQNLKFQMREIVLIISFSSLLVFVIVFSMDAGNWKVRVYTWTFHSDFFRLLFFLKVSKTCLIV